MAPGAPKPPASPLAANLPLSPAATPTPAAPAAVGVKPTPKKDTVRIEVPNAKQVPQATVKLQQTQPLVRPPAAEVRTLAAPAVVDLPGDTAEGVEDEGFLKMVSIGVFALALLTVAIQLWGLLANR